MAPGMSYFLPCNLGDHFNCPLEILTTIFTRWHKMTSDDLWGSFNFRSYDLIKLIQLTVRNQYKTFQSNGPGIHSMSSPESSLRKEEIYALLPPFQSSVGSQRWEELFDIYIQSPSQGKNKQIAKDRKGICWDKPKILAAYHWMYFPFGEKKCNPTIIML